MAKEKKGKKTCRTSIGGQAVLEGVMMLGKNSMATAVRDENKNIQVEAKRIKANSDKSFWRKVPFVRGVLNFGSTMYKGVGIILRSSEVFEGETEPSKFEKWCATKLHLNVMSVMMGFAVILGLALSIGLFFVLPHFIIRGFKLIPGAMNVPEVVFTIIEGVIRIFIFVGYILLTSLMKEIKRVYMYHGAEHKTISCYEYGLPLTVENVQKQSTIHDRCGTTFMFIVMVISILVFSITGFAGKLPQWSLLLIKLALLPVVAGISYEILKFLAKFDNWFVRIIKAPGLLLQKVTTKQPTDDMVEVAIAAFNTVLAMDADPEIPETKFDTKIMYNKARKSLDTIVEGIDGADSDIDWIICHVLKIKRSELETLSYFRSNQYDKMAELANKRKEGIPLQQILGDTDFYGITLKVTDKVLCPRPETEYLVEQAIKLIKQNKLISVLDMCTGSGAIAIAVKSMAENTQVTAVDISIEALEVAKQNATSNNADINFIESNLFESVEEKFDIIISNPPYIKTADIANLDTTVRDHEPIIALDGGVDGLDFYRAIAKEAKQHLNDGGYVALEVGIDQAGEVANILTADYCDINLFKDLEGVDRIVVAKKLEEFIC